MLVQAVDHPSRLYIDVESNDVEAEVVGLEQLGAGISQVKRGGSWKLYRSAILRCTASAIARPPPELKLGATTSRY